MQGHVTHMEPRRSLFPGGGGLKVRLSELPSGQPGSRRGSEGLRRHPLLDSQLGPPSPRAESQAAVAGDDRRKE